MGARRSPGRRTREVRFAVDDDGEGVAADVADRMFEPFFTTKPTGAGAGLGLAVVQGIVEEAGGRIEVGESPLGGARFAIAFPCTREEDRHGSG